MLQFSGDSRFLIQSNRRFPGRLWQERRERTMAEDRAKRYLPSFWHDDIAMQGYMSVIKVRS